MGITATDYTNVLTNLLPPGPAWDVIPGSVLALFLDAWSQELSRIQSRSVTLIDESDPRTTNELLTDYERIFGLPTDCMVGISQTLQQRHNALVAQMTSIGGQSKAYFINLAVSAGFTITITEFTFSTVSMTVADLITDGQWAYAWQVNSALYAVSAFTVLSSVSDPLAVWGNTALECLINRFKPAHTSAIFAYT